MAAAEKGGEQVPPTAEKLTPEQRDELDTLRWQKENTPDEWPAGSS